MAEGDQEDDAQKTEDPTPKKLEDARKRGQIPLSRELNNWLMLLAGTLVITAFAKPVMTHLMGVMRVFIARAHDIPSAPGGIAVALHEAFMGTLTAIALPLLFLFVIAFIGPFIQIGPLFSTQAIEINWAKISPIAGMKRLFSLRSIVEFVKGIAKLCVIGIIGVIILYPYFDRFEHLIGMPYVQVMDELIVLIIRLMIGVLVAFAIIAGLDVLYQRFEHYKKMRMTKQEVKDEYKQLEGDPHVKARLRGLRAEKARQRMMQNVPRADVVITNPTHYSIALRYRPEESPVPVCVAKGINEVALRIRELAKEHDILIYENKPLARSLYDLVDIDEAIPEEQYKAVAEVISYVYKVKGRPTH